MNERPEKPTWDELKELLRWLAILFGRPSDLWREAAVTREIGFLIRGWLCALEAIVRALLLLMAAEQPKPGPQSPTRPRRAASPVDPPTEEIDPDADASDSERWTGVSFALAPQAPTKSERRPRKEPLRFFATRRLALRFEALIRVAEKPERYARRMARRLHRNPRRVFRVLRWPRLPGCRTAPRDAVARAQAYAWLASGAFEADTG